jgi:hypothetical protein
MTDILLVNVPPEKRAAYTPGYNSDWPTDRSPCYEGTSGTADDRSDHAFPSGTTMAVTWMDVVVTRERGLGHHDRRRKKGREKGRGKFLGHRNLLRRFCSTFADLNWFRPPRSLRYRA